MPKKCNYYIYRMPWHIIEENGGYYVVTTSTGRRHSNEPLTMAKAKKQLMALEINADKKHKKKK